MLAKSVGKGGKSGGRGKAYGAEVRAQALKSWINTQEPQLDGENAGTLCLLPAMSIKGNQEKIPRPRPLFISDTEDYLSHTSLDPLKYDRNIYPPLSPTKIGLEKYTYTR